MKDDYTKESCTENMQIFEFSFITLHSRKWIFFIFIYHIYKVLERITLQVNYMACSWVDTKNKLQVYTWLCINVSSFKQISTCSIFPWVQVNFYWGHCSWSLQKYELSTVSRVQFHSHLSYEIYRYASTSTMNLLFLLWFLLLNGLITTFLTKIWYHTGSFTNQYHCESSI